VNGYNPFEAQGNCPRPASSPPSIPPLPPISPLQTGETVVEVLTSVTTLQLTLAGDASSIDTAALEASLRTQLQCAPPCQLSLILSAGSVNVAVRMTIPVADASVVATVVAATTSFVAQTPSAIATSLGGGLTVESVDQTVSTVQQVLAVAVAPPPPSPPPPQSNSDDDDGLPIGALIGIIAGALVLMGVLGFVVWKQTKNKVKVVSAA